MVQLFLEVNEVNHNRNFLSVFEIIFPKEKREKKKAHTTAAAMSQAKRKRNKRGRCAVGAVFMP
jgi:hypothetical protein